MKTALIAEGRLFNDGMGGEHLRIMIQHSDRDGCTIKLMVNQNAISYWFYWRPDTNRTCDPPLMRSKPILIEFRKVLLGLKITSNSDLKQHGKKTELYFGYKYYYAATNEMIKGYVFT